MRTNWQVPRAVESWPSSTLHDRLPAIVVIQERAVRVGRQLSVTSGPCLVPGRAAWYRSEWLGRWFGKCHRLAPNARIRRRGMSQRLAESWRTVRPGVCYWAAIGCCCASGKLAHRCSHLAVIYSWSTKRIAFSCSCATWLSARHSAISGSLCNRTCPTATLHLVGCTLLAFPI